MPKPAWPKLDFATPNNSAVSLNVLAEFARRGDVKVFQDGLDATGKLVIRLQLPGSETIKAKTYAR